MAGFLDALKSRCEVVELDGGRDWRRGVGDEGEVMESRSSWLGIGDKGFEEAWATVAGPEGVSRLILHGLVIRSRLVGQTRKGLTKSQLVLALFRFMVEKLGCHWRPEAPVASLLPSFARR